MRTKCCLFILLFLLPTLSITVAAGSTSLFPCVLDHSYVPNEYKEYVEINLREWYRAQIDNWEDDNLMVESGSAIVLDQSVLIIDLHFSNSFDYEARDMHVPEQITFFNHEPNVSDETGTPEWQVTIFPDQDDPYAFHYFGTFNWTMAGIHMSGSYINPEGELNSCFSFQIAVY